ncbi:MAG: SAM-dependent methyltransferase, partial [Actinomycetota bacterium]|nr:SAM-dependent methyltransferase [Actinomycetota bacterium]
RMTRENKVVANAGRYLFSWATQVSFSSIDASSSTWTFSTDETRQWWGGLWAERIQKSTFADQIFEHDLGSQDLLDELSAAFKRWADKPDGFFLVPHGEIIAIK